MCRSRQKLHHTATVCAVNPHDRDKLFLPPPDRNQNVLLRQLKFPSEICKGDFFMEFWTHQMDPGLLVELMTTLKSKSDPLTRLFFSESTDESFLEVCQRLVGRRFQATGGMAVSFITTGSEFEPTVRITVVGMATHRCTYSSVNHGPHVLKRAVHVTAPHLGTISTAYGCLEHQHSRNSPFHPLNWKAAAARYLEYDELVA